MAKSMCAVEGCSRPVIAKGLCTKHYQRKGDPAAKRAHELTTEQRFWLNVASREAAECWLWTGSLDVGGYGRFALTHRKGVKAHRYAYELLVGSIPEGLELDHVRARGCQHRHCVNPAHLEPVTNLENLRRAGAAGMVNAAKTHCIRGHPLSGENLYVRPNGKRECIACRTARKRRDRSGK